MDPDVGRQAPGRYTSGRALGKPHRAAWSQAADRVGYDTAWVAEHHFSNKYGIMPDVFTYMGYLAAQTSRIRPGTAVVTVPPSRSASREPERHRVTLCKTFHFTPDFSAHWEVGRASLANNLPFAFQS
jgi:hypothetical protein